MNQPPPQAASRQHDSKEARLDEMLDSQRDWLKQRFPLPPRRQAAPARRIAPLALLLLGLAAGLYGWDPAYRHEVFATAIGEQQQLTLADGSRLTLDTGSRVEVAWHLFSRRLQLQHGQARFDIAHAVWRPLTVQAGEHQVRVLGTRFDIRYEQQAFALRLLQGRIALSWQGKPLATLKAGDVWQSRSAQPQGQPSAQPLPFDSASWQQGRLQFDATPLAQAVAEIQRHVPQRLYLAPALAEVPLSGQFDSRDSARLLQLLPQILPLRLQPQADGSLLLAAR